MEFIETDLAGALFREADLSRVKMAGVLLIDADIDGAIDGLRINGVEVAPLVEAELDRLHPERITLRATDVAGMREAWSVVQSFWAETITRARSLSEADRHRSVNDEWSLTQTLRHLVFVTDMWFRSEVLGEPAAYHPIGLPAGLKPDGEGYGQDPAANPTFEEVVEVRAARMAEVTAFLASATQEDLDLARGPRTTAGWPPPVPRTAVQCLHVVFNDEWAHHQFAIRDLAIIEAVAVP